MPGWERSVYRKVSINCFLKCISLEHTHQVNYKVSADFSTDWKGSFKTFSLASLGSGLSGLGHTFPQSGTILSHAPALRKLQIIPWGVFFLIEIPVCENSLKNTSPLLTSWKGFCICDTSRIRDSNLRPKQDCFCYLALWTTQTLNTYSFHSLSKFHLLKLHNPLLCRVYHTDSSTTLSFRQN